MHKFVAILKNIQAIRLFLILFYLIGAAGLLIPFSTGIFIQLTPIALLLSFGLLMLHHQNGFPLKTMLVFLFIFITGIVVEIIGVRTGIIFGNYAYASGLGIKIFETPLLIGMNWLLLVYTTATIVQNVKFSKILQITAGASMMLVYDLILEQVAPKMHMWSWLNDSVPYANYIAWWLIAAAFHTLIVYSGIKIKNPLSIVVLVVQFLFFVLLYFFM